MLCFHAICALHAICAQNQNQKARTLQRFQKLTGFSGEKIEHFWESTPHLRWLSPPISSIGTLLDATHP